MSTLRETLRSLPTFPDELPGFDAERSPADPLALFLVWLSDAIASGERQPNAMTLTTVDADGAPASRTLIVKDIDEHGFRFSSSRSSRKGGHLERRPIATMLFFWRPLGRQVEVSGPVLPMDEESADDWRERPNFDGSDNPDWQVWSLQPERFEFLQATHDRAHVRVEYLREGEGWRHERLAPSERSPRNGTHD